MRRLPEFCRIVTVGPAERYSTELLVAIERFCCWLYVELTPDDVREIDSAASKIRVHEALYEEHQRRRRGTEKVPSDVKEERR